MLRNLIFALIIAMFSGILLANWSLDWTGEPGFENDGVDPDEGLIGASYQFRVKFNSDKPSTHPRWVELHIDLNEDGMFEDNETFMMTPAEDSRDVWTFTKRIIISEGRTQRPHISYYFQAQTDNQIKTSELTYGPIVGGFNNSFLIEGKGWFVEEALLPMQFKTMEQMDRIVITNTSSIAQVISLSIPKNVPGPFHPLEDVTSIEPNGYVVSAVITDIETERLDDEDFNRFNSEDVVTIEKKTAGGRIFSVRNRSAGEVIEPGQSVAIWLQLRAPATGEGEEALGEQMVYIRLEVGQAN